MYVPWARVRVVRGGWCLPPVAAQGESWLLRTVMVAALPALPGAGHLRNGEGSDMAMKCHCQLETTRQWPSPVSECIARRPAKKLYK